jgi:predicted acetyltransferase
VDPTLELRIVTAETRPVIEALWQLYRHDLSEFRNSLPDEHGLFRRHHLPNYLDEPGKVAYLLYYCERPAGLALVQGLGGAHREMSEFFVVRRLRRQHVGHQVALELLARYPGRWEIAFQEENLAGASFWREVATAAVGDAWTEEPRQSPRNREIPPDIWIMLDTSR